MKYTIEPYHALPCALETFIINGVNATVEDFGEVELSGNCMESECCSTFVAAPPKPEVLEKYYITEDEYLSIRERLEEELYVRQCGWCS